MQVRLAIEHNFDVLLRNRSGLETASGVITHEVSLGHEGKNTYQCTCSKPMLLYKPYFYVLVACDMLKMDSAQ